MSKSVGIIIPARYESTRLPGKPLIDFHGKSMIQRTWERCIQAIHRDFVYIATDSAQIFEHANLIGANVVMTSSDCLTGTDRVAEANRSLNLDLVINVQGDEPIIDPEDILKVISFAKNNEGLIVNAIAPIKEEEYRSLTIPKVAKTLDDNLLYMSRAPIPSSKSNLFDFGYKQICIYAFPKKALEIFAEQSSKTPFECIEDIEILRFLELGESVKLVEVSGRSMAVDVENDVEAVRKIIFNLESTL